MTHLNPWLYSDEELAEPLAKWRRDELLHRIDSERAIAKAHSASAAYWHRQALRAREAEVDRSKYISTLESEVSA